MLFIPLLSLMSATGVLQERLANVYCRRRRALLWFALCSARRRGARCRVSPQMGLRTRKRYKISAAYPPSRSLLAPIEFSHGADWLVSRGWECNMDGAACLQISEILRADGPAGTHFCTPTASGEAPFRSNEKHVVHSAVKRVKRRFSIFSESGDLWDLRGERKRNLLRVNPGVG